MLNFLEKFFKKKKKSTNLDIEKIKLENEVLKDKVKQLEAKIKTLEKALEKSLKS